MNRPEPIAYFRTAGSAYVVVRPNDTGQNAAECGGCGWTQTNRAAVRDASSTAARPGSTLGPLEHDANEHALHCAKMPRHLWPADQSMSGGW